MDFISDNSYSQYFCQILKCAFEYTSHSTLKCNATEGSICMLKEYEVLDKLDIV